MKEILKMMKDTLIQQTQAQVSNLQCVDYRELGEAVDMIKDLEEALYYCAVIAAMEDTNKEKEEYRSAPSTYYYTERYMPMRDEYYRDMDRQDGKMYYSGGTSPWANISQVSRDGREGRSGTSRRMYMESKELHQDKAKQLKDLETYMNELTNDMTEMIKGTSPEEKQLLQKKLTMLSQKIEQMN